MKEGNPTIANTELCEKMLSPCNIREAIKNVKRNNGASGVDGMKVSEIDEFMKGNWECIKTQILARKYKPKPVRRVEIPKENGGVRLLGVPTVIDRVIQQAMVQVLSPLFEPTFSEWSYGFRPNRNAEEAVRKAQEYMAEGYTHVVDLDLSKFFDTVNHDLLMTFVDRTLEDKDIRRLIFVYLKSGVMEDGSFTSSETGTPQGGPLSPLLSNIYLTPYDKELEKRGLKFVRYADDSNIFTKSGYASRRVKESVTRYLENKLKLKVNKDKTEARSCVGSTFLGFEFLTCGKEGKKGYIKPKKKKLEKFESRIKEITKRNRGVSIEKLIVELNTYLRGWINYYGRSNLKSYMASTASRLYRRIRQYLWKMWKKPGKRKEMLIKLCPPKARNRLRHFNAYSSNRYWAMSMVLNTFITRETLFNDFGVLNIEGYWKQVHNKKMQDDDRVEKTMYLDLGLNFS